MRASAVTGVVAVHSVNVRVRFRLTTAEREELVALRHEARMSSELTCSANPQGGRIAEATGLGQGPSLLGRNSFRERRGRAADAVVDDTDDETRCRAERRTTKP